MDIFNDRTNKVVHVSSLDELTDYTNEENRIWLKDKFGLPMEQEEFHPWDNEIELEYIAGLVNEEWGWRGQRLPMEECLHLAVQKDSDFAVVANACIDSMNNGVLRFSLYSKMIGCAIKLVIEDAKPLVGRLYRDLWNWQSDPSVRERWAQALSR